ncbi:MAG: hypothetical protein LCH88_09030 [Proteobacteria bacterium]|nr:hypothetical protein [Pseudomonadota bacterium]
MPPSIDIDFEQLPILPPFTGADGRSYHRDIVATGRAAIAFDGRDPESWYVRSIHTETTETAAGPLRFLLHPLPATDPLFPLIRDAVARDYEQEIAAAIKAWRRAA